jgi:alpha-tubulin suppressor-like RCC1 family protein
LKKENELYFFSTKSEFEMKYCGRIHKSRIDRSATSHIFNYQQMRKSTAEIWRGNLSSRPPQEYDKSNECLRIIDYKGVGKWIDSNSLVKLNREKRRFMKHYDTLAAGRRHTVGLKSDGTVKSTGTSRFGLCNVGVWHDIVAVAAGYSHTVGLRSNGMVEAVGRDIKDQCKVGTWRDIVAVAAGSYHTIGLRSDGTVVAVGWNEYGQCNVGNWCDIVAVAAGCAHTLGLKSDGTVVAAGDNEYGQCDISGWLGIQLPGN